MSTVIRPVVSSRNQYKIGKHRYYELKHFCLQYRDWKEQLMILCTDLGIATPRKEAVRANRVSDNTADIAMARSILEKNIELVDAMALAADQELSFYIKKAVTEGVSFVNLKSRYSVPCERDMFYNRYRKFFWLLSRSKN